MIVKFNRISFSVEFEKPDWAYAYTYILLELLRSIPKSDRKYDYARHIWFVNNKYKHILNRTQVFTDEEESEGLQEFTSFINLFN